MLIESLGEIAIVLGNFKTVPKEDLLLHTLLSLIMWRDFQSISAGKSMRRLIPLVSDVEGLVMLIEWVQSFHIRARTRQSP